MEDQPTQQRKAHCRSEQQTHGALSRAKIDVVKNKGEAGDENDPGHKWPLKPPGGISPEGKQEWF